MAETEARLCTRYGAAAAKATLARNILAPVAGRLSGHPSELHRRCILLRRLSSSRNTGTTADLCERFSAARRGGRRLRRPPHGRRRLRDRRRVAGGGGGDAERELRHRPSPLLRPSYRPRRRPRHQGASSD
uniref:Uncharacterized protein n=1 Tax=Oryza glaberrima TaxID=4538 RepID=I1QCF8_ORYGL